MPPFSGIPIQFQRSSDTFSIAHRQTLPTNSFHPACPGTVIISHPPPPAPTQTTIATDYDFSDDFTTAQYIPPRQGPLLIPHKPPSLSPEQPFVQRLLYQVTPRLTAQHLPFSDLALFIMAFVRHCRVLISDCWHRRVKIRSVVNPVLFALFVCVVGKGIWDAAVLRGELEEVQRGLETCARLTMTPPPETGTRIVLTRTHDDD
jgi:hypothetical protein